MKFTLSWLKDHLETDAPLEEISDKLTAIGLEVEGIEDRAKDFDGFVVGHVTECKQHPNADKLRLCIVDTGAEKLQVVCGAPNAKQGMKGVFAPSGSYIPGSDFTLKKAEIRGEESNGMLCSERELCLSDEHDGIIELDDSVETGSPAAAALGLDDPVIEIALTPNRADCAGVRGIARDLAAAGLGTLKPLKTSAVKGSGAPPIKVDLKLDDAHKDACPLFLGRYIKGVKNGPSPAWLQDRLRAVGLRPISALVDITNYVTLDLNRPLHVFDADNVKGDVHVRFAKKGEKLDALNDKSYELEDGMTAVCDDSGVLGLGGIIGGTSTGCEADTANVYVECAYFDPVRTAHTGRALQIDSDARYRFERGIDPAFTAEGMEIATQMILDLCGGEASDVYTAGGVPEWKREIKFDPGFTEKLGGVTLSDDAQKDILTTLGFEVETGKDAWTITPPSWRGDVEGRADIVEEVLRVYGYDNIETVRMPRGEQIASPLTPEQKRVIAARRTLAARGLNESVTWSFMATRFAEQFGVNDQQAQKSLTLVNPISSELDVMRPSIIPNLVQAAQQNADRGQADSALFEIGPCYRTAEHDGQLTVAAGIRTGRAVARHWATDARGADAIDAKADALALLDAIGGPAGSAQVTTDAPDWYHPGRSGVLRLGPNVLACFGELHPAVLEELDADGPVAAFEVFLDTVPLPRQKDGFTRPPLHVSSLQPVRRDFAFVLDRDVAAGDLIRAVTGADKKLISDVEIFDVYEGKGVEDGKKSLAISVTLQPTKKTLTDAEIEGISKSVVANVEKKTGGTLRG